MKEAFRWDKEQSHVIPFVPGIRMMVSYREAQETAEFGEVLRYSSDSELEKEQDKPEQTTMESDTTGSTP